MYPVGSNGASQAILDARCLADKLSSADNPMHALWLYEQERLPLTAQIVRMNRKGGPEGVIDAVERLAPQGFSNVDDVLSHDQRQAIVRGYASTAGFVPGLMNTAPAA
jgi:2-polyprenyl-6-methoxyphenol hydroxylase-like FAD-dependent oxidoreductase